MFKIFFRVGIGITFLVLVACHSSSIYDESASGPLGQIYPLLNARQYDEAILRLQKLAERDSRPRVKVVLASAYAGRAGLEVRQLWNMGMTLRKLFPEDEPIATNESQKALLEIYRPLKRSLFLIDQFVAMNDPIPSVSIEGRDDIQRARKSLEGLKTPDARAYNAILGVVLFKSVYLRGPVSPTDIQSALKVAFQNQWGDSSSKAVCTLPIASWREWIYYLVGLAAGIMDDADLAWPSKAEFISDWRQAFLKIADDLNKNPSLPPECR